MVPEAHANPVGARIGLRVFRARGVPGRTPIVFLHGGPGGSVRSFAEGGFAERYARLFGRDVLLLEQRGNALSSPALDCRVDETGAPTVESVERCVETYARKGTNLGAFNTIESAHDVEALRRALDVPKLIVWGSSYGAYLAAVMARIHPGSIEALLLESPALTGRPYRSFDQYRRRASKVDAFYTWLQEACAANDRCATEYPALDPAAEMATLIERAKTAPVEVADGVTISSELGARRALLRTMYSIPTAVLFIRAVHASNRGTLDAFDAAIKIRGLGVRAYLADRISTDGISFSTNQTVNCYDLTRNWTDEGLAQATAGLFTPEEQAALPTTLAEEKALCAAYPAPTAPQADFPVPTTTALPTLFVVGDLDHPTPVEDVVADQPRFTRSQLVRFSCVGHGTAAAAPACFEALASGFLSQAADGSFDPAARALDAACAAARCTTAVSEATTDLFVELR